MTSLTLLYNHCDALLEEEFPTILQCLGEHGERVFDITRTARGFRIVECCDQYYGITLSQDQMRRLINELQALLET